MSAQAVTTTSTATLAPARDARLIPYCAIAIGALGAALVSGQPALAALAAPFALALALGLRHTQPVHVTACVTLDTDQVLEGDVVTGHIELAWDAELQPHALLHRLRGVAHPGTGPSWSLGNATRSLELPMALTATQWGRHSTGEIWLRLRDAHGLLTWTGKVAAAPTLRVLPQSERLTRLLDPAEYRAVLGLHRSRRFGAGSEFAELRQYSPGDRLRDLNWAATARRRKPLVNAHHPELSGDVVIALDAFDDGSTGSTEALARAARAAWALASIHLRSNDRVGLAGLGGSTRWLAPASGRRAQYRLLETLLGMGGDPVDLPRDGLPRINVPASALVVAITSLHEQATIAALESWRGHGRMVAVVVVDTSDLLGVALSAGDVLGRRLWRIELERRRRELTELGIPVVTLAADGRIGPVVSGLRRARRAPVVRRR